MGIECMGIARDREDFLERIETFCHLCDGMGGV